MINETRENYEIDYDAPRYFGWLVKEIQNNNDLLERFQGDLFHDATWINKHKPDSFIWVLRKSGTHISTGECEAFQNLIYDADNDARFYILKRKLDGERQLIKISQIDAYKYCGGKIK
jgi:hypothetical protein